MIPKAVAAAIAAIVLLAANSCHTGASSTETDPQIVAAALGSIERAVATGGYPSKGCRALGLDDLECDNLVDIANRGVMAVTKHPAFRRMMRDKEDQTGHQLARLQCLMSTIPETSEAVHELAALLPPGKKDIELVKKYRIALRPAVRKRPRRIGKHPHRMSKRGLGNWFKRDSPPDVPDEKDSEEEALLPLELDPAKSADEDSRVTRVLRSPRAGESEQQHHLASKSAKQVPDAEITATVKELVDMTLDPNRQCDWQFGDAWDANDYDSRWIEFRPPR